MTDAVHAPASIPARSKSANDLYRAVWRWHFYAGLLVLPFLITLSITGALYLFRTEIDAIVHADLKRVPVPEGASKTQPSAMIAAALAAHPGVALKYTDAPTKGDSVEITVKSSEQSRLAVYVDPYSCKVLGSLPDRGTTMWTIRYLHSLRYFGPVARAIIEIVGGWAVLLVATGLYLWWPRRQAGGVVSVRGTPSRRVFWRDLHAVTGIFVGSVIVFLVITGMPWSGVWGAKVNEWANGTNFGYPAGVRVAVPMSGEHLDHVAMTSWSLEQAKIPESSAARGAKPIGIDEAVGTFDRLGLHRGYSVALPTTATGVYSGSVYPDDLASQRVVHLDRYSGQPLIDMSYADYGPLGKWLEFGINVHMGQQFGLANKLVLLAACVAIVMLAVSAGVMWWKRRPSGSLGVPPLPSDHRAFRGLIAILVTAGLIFPLMGLSLLIMLALDFGYRRVAELRTA